MNLKKVASLALVGTFLATSGSTSVFAEKNTTNFKNGVIPDKMSGGTVILFDQDNNPTIINNGIEYPLSYPTLDLSNENKSVLDSPISSEEFYKVLSEIDEEAKNLPVYYIEDEKPQPGTIVMYGTDGGITSIENAVPTVTPKATAANGTYVYGKSNNKITITSSKVSGVGRFTVFDNIKGDHDNPLVAGDVATKAAYDNPKSGTKITAIATNTNITKTVVKNENGGLPDAILDVKKWTGTLFGYTYSTTLSFPGSYYYSR